VLKDRNDLKLFKDRLPVLLPPGQHRPAPTSPTLLFLQTENESEISNKDRKAFLKWGRKTFYSSGFSDTQKQHVVKLTKEACDKEAHTQIKGGNFGLVLIGKNRHQLWRKRILYKERRKVIALIGSSIRQNQILVPVDLSKNTLLVLRFLHQSYIGRSEFKLDFLHVLTKPKKWAERRWIELKRIIDLNGDMELRIVPTNGEISDTILECVRAKNQGTIVMGKRGDSGIKQRLLGSVSAGVLRSLTDQSLILVD
jgi:nucleotide-binding universal stress UspA family protein